MSVIVSMSLEFAECDRARLARALTERMAAAEARASGIPVIVPDRGGAADHARQGGGWTYTACSSRSASDAILRALAAPQWVPAPEVRTMEHHFADLFADYKALIAGSRRAA